MLFGPEIKTRTIFPTLWRELSIDLLRAGTIWTETGTGTSPQQVIVIFLAVQVVIQMKYTVLQRYFYEVTIVDALESSSF